MEKSLIIKKEIQDKVLEYSEIYNNIVLNWSTGTGKTLAALNIVNRYSDKKWYIVCKEISHINNWNTEIQKFGLQDLLLNIEFLCYDSLHKLSEPGNFILDECHAITELRFSYINKLKLDRIIALSATIPFEKRILLQRLMFKAKWYSISTKEAIDIGLLPEPVIYIHMLNLNNSNRTLVYNRSYGDVKSRIKLSCDYPDRFKFFKKYKSINLDIKCTEQEYYSLIDDNIKYYKSVMIKLDKKIPKPKDKDNWAKMRFLQETLRRKNFISECKESTALSIISMLNNKRYVFYANSIKQCEKLANKFPVVHSGNKNNQDLINKFNNKEIDKIFAVRMLRESINFTDIEAGIVLQMDSYPGATEQIEGRTLRHESPELHIITVKNTQDEIYLNRFLNNVDKTHIKYINYE